MKVLITGSNGFIGSALNPFLKENGYQVAKLVRSRENLTDDSAVWEPENNVIDIPKLDRIAGNEGFAAVINLAGKNLSTGKWTDKVKAEILDSRVKGTKLLCETLPKLKHMPKVLISASAVGFYGNRGTEILNEDSEPGKNYLSEVVKKWEEATKPASDAGIRVVNARFGLVLSTKGGMLKRMISAARVGGALPFGEGEQYMSWITIEDLERAIVHAIRAESLSGPVNFTSQSAVTNKDFMMTLQYRFKSPVFMHIPDFVLRWIFGEMADDVLLSSARVMPVKLLMSGFRFKHLRLEQALNYLMDNKV